MVNKDKSYNIMKLIKINKTFKCLKKKFIFILFCTFMFSQSSHLYSSELIFQKTYNDAKVLLRNYRKCLGDNYSEYDYKQKIITQWFKAFTDNQIFQNSNDMIPLLTKDIQSELALLILYPLENKNMLKCYHIAYSVLDKMYYQYDLGIEWLNETEHFSLISNEINEINNLKDNLKTKIDEANKKYEESIKLLDSE